MGSVGMCQTLRNHYQTKYSSQVKADKKSKVSTHPGFTEVCHFTVGDGTGGDEDKINDYMSGQDCARECKKNSKYNGATIMTDNSGGCWCEYGMTGKNNYSTDYKTCLF